MSERKKAARRRGEDGCADVGAAAGERVVVRDQRGKLQAERRAGHRWSAKAEAVFLAELEATCNVMASAAAAGFSTTAVYRRRQSYAAFRSAWEAALDTGYARLEMALVCAATNLLAPVPPLEDGGRDAATAAPPFGGMTAREALQVLRLHRFSARGGSPQRFGWRAKPADPEVTRAEILRKLDIVERHDAKKCGGKARARR
ncbi:hypothetical protein [Sphingopyxis sp.]|uniref:hypothetical protein n=1 Tax=Sphingopyxis sp. TaxID=1908224 RepID=UPI002B48030B|nr:hypothetical protein [Sphingopyxis sp.]HJS10093.1 hypothetical protein [Sphingopyxis sp.]